MNNPLPNLNEPIQTKRLYIRGLQKGDGKNYYKVSLRNKEHLAEFESDNVVNEVKSEEGAESIVRELAEGWEAGKYFFMGMFDKKTDDFVGQIYVGPANWDLPEFQIGYFADVDQEGKGYITEAVRAVIEMLFDKCMAHRIRLDCSDRNVRSIKVAERCGLTREGYFRENKKHPDGSFSGDVHYAILKNEFDLLKSSRKS